MSVADAPTGVVTFLFTDIEGSTRRWESDAAAMRVALAAHDEVLRASIETRGGWLFKHTGDGVCAAFASPRAAVDAAVAAQLELELPVRMGIATGEAELRGEDYFGVALNRAARVMAAGHGGQVLLADTTAGLVTGVDLIDLGLRRLRDLSTTVEVFQVREDGLPTDFPPLRTLDPTPGNLRPQTIGLIGRDKELEQVLDELHGHRLVTLTGVGGVGKTRLALKAASLLAAEFPDGVWVFELAAVNDPAAVPAAVAAVLGITQQPGKSLIESVAAALEGRVRLLVFDNCEHILDAAAEVVEAILAESTTVTILATSREGLGVEYEQLWPVPSLDVDAGADSAAASLFVERARSVAPTLSLTQSEDSAAVVEICRRLDGIPLAIELAASRMASMTAVDVRDRLDQRFRLLVGSRRGLERHHTLRHAVAWSYDLLDDAEKELLKRCSAFSGGFDLESICAITGSDISDDFVVLDLLDALVRKSLLVVDRSAGRTRYSMLETIRQFAEEQIASHKAAEARNAHARHFAARESDVLALWDGPHQREAYDWFTIELANLRGAFRWSADHGNLDAAATIATYSAFLGILTDNFEPMAWAEELIGQAQRADHPRLAALYVMASQCYRAGRPELAVRNAEAGKLVLDSGRENIPYGIEGWLGGAYVYVGQPQRTVDWCRAVLARGCDTHALSTAFLVFALVIAGSPDDAVAAADGLVEAADLTHNPYVRSYALLAYGFAFRNTDPDLARDALRRGLAIAQDSGNRSNESHIASSLCGIEAKHGEPLAAFEYFTLAIGAYLDAGESITIRVPLAQLVAVFDRLGRHEPAATIAGFVVSPLTALWVPGISSAIAHLRGELGEATYATLAHVGGAMTPAAVATYAYDQIDLARAEMSGL